MAKIEQEEKEEHERKKREAEKKKHEIEVAEAMAKKRREEDVDDSKMVRITKHCWQPNASVWTHGSTLCNAILGNLLIINELKR